MIRVVSFKTYEGTVKGLSQFFEIALFVYLES